MFSSTNTNNNMSPFPQYYFTSSSIPPSNYLLQPLPQLPISNHHDFLSYPNPNPNLFQPDPNPPISVSPASIPARKPPAAKKDRHSKIHTAQGLRDRRVRLSIDIARQFFDLHDLLGFDKASKTLEWLLSKSRTAITELSRNSSRMSHVGDDVASSAAKDPRSVARARARARAKEKRYGRHVSTPRVCGGNYGEWHSGDVEVFDEISPKGEILNENYNSNYGMYFCSTCSMPANWDINCT